MATRKPRPADLSDPDARAGWVADVVADKINAKAVKINEKAAKINAKAAQHERVAAKAAFKAEVLQRAAEHVQALELWTRPGPRTRRPRFTREEIAATAIRIADAEGFAAVSMRRLAAELDAGTMTLYHYVRTKDELLTLLTDAVMGEVVVPDHHQFPAHWRDAITLVAQRTRAALQRHPWILDITDDPPIGPNSVRHFDQSLQTVSSLDLPLEAKFDIVLGVDEYVFGYCLHDRNNLQPESSATDRDMMKYVEHLVTTGDYPQIAALVEEFGLEPAWEKIGAQHRDPDRFVRNLDRFLDGIEAGLEKK